MHAIFEVNEEVTSTLNLVCHRVAIVFADAGWNEDKSISTSG